MRMSLDHYFLTMAMTASARATCSRRRVGAIAVDREDHIISTGYNGTPKGTSHCTDTPCAGSSFGPGEGLDVCQSIHAEINCIAQCESPRRISTMYVTCSPCVSCMKAIIATGCRRIVTMEIYSEDAVELFASVEGDVIKIPSAEVIKQLEKIL